MRSWRARAAGRRGAGLALLLRAAIPAAIPAAALAEEERPPPNALALRGGAFLLFSPAVSGHPAGPDVEASWTRTIWDLVAFELAAGAYTVALPNTGTRLGVAPVSLSIRITAAPERGWAAYMVAGLGVSFTRLSGGTWSEPASAEMSYQAGLGVTHPWGERAFFGGDARYTFHQVAGPLAQANGLRLSALLGTRF